MGKYREFWTSGSNANLYTLSCHSGVKACIFAFENYKSYRIPHPLLVPSNEMPMQISRYFPIYSTFKIPSISEDTWSLQCIDTCFLFVSYDLFLETTWCAWL
jgi:hypothetical protein